MEMVIVAVSPCATHAGACDRSLRSAALNAVKSDASLQAPCEMVCEVHLTCMLLGNASCTHLTHQC